MTLLRKNIEFIVSETSAIKENTIDYFTKSGFKLINESTDRTLKFQRGSISNNMWTFNPLKWKSEIGISINGQVVKADFNINTLGQIPTSKEEGLWDTFIDNYRKTLNERNFDFLTENNKTVKTTKSDSLKYVGWAAVGGMMGGIPAGLIAYLTGMHSIVSIAAVGGAIALLTKKINDDKDKEAL